MRVHMHMHVFPEFAHRRVMIMCVRHAQGTYTHENGDTYTCMFRANAPNGHGTKRYTNGDVYTGSFANWERQGEVRACVVTRDK